MPVFALTDEVVFPRPELATPEGLLAVGGDLRPERLLLAYGSGIFPWPVQGYPPLWHSPDPRFVLPPPTLTTSRSLRQTLRKRPFSLTLDTAFRDVMSACSEVPRPGQDGTWITDEMLDAYTTLHELGFAHSVEAWQDGRLVGGLYGVSIGACFCGESMFARVSDASKVAFVHFVRQLQDWGYNMIDCQVKSEHLSSLGAEDLPRRQFIARLNQWCELPGVPGPWRFDSATGAIEPLTLTN